MKKIFSLLFIFVIAFLVVGCGDKPDPTPEKKEYTVEFVVDGKVIDTQKVEEGKSATAPSDPKKDGYEFKGWDKDFTNVTSDLKVNAKFEKTTVETKKYTVKFLVDGKVIDTQEVEEGKSATAPSDPKKDGYEFKGWDKDFTNVTSDLETNAVFEEAKVYHTVEFLVEGKTYATVKVEHGKAAELPEQPTLEGKYFAGWLKDTSNVTEDMRVRAKFVEVNLEPKEVKDFPLQIGKAPITRYISTGTGYDTNSSLYTTRVFLIPGKGNGNIYWYRIFIKNEGGYNRVVEVAPRGASQKTETCDWTILCYTDALAEVLANTGVKEGDIINFSKHPTAFTETTDCNEFFTVSRLTDMEAYLLDSDTAHTVVALHKIKKYFESLGQIISLDKIDLPTFDGETSANITWTIDKAEIIAPDGTINLPDDVTEITLTAIAVYETSTYKQTYVLKVGKVSG